MTYLELVQRAALECGIAGTITTVANQTGELKRLVNWVADAWFRIQGKHSDWRFLRTTATWATVAGQAQYTTLQCGITAGTFGRWIPDSFRNYLSTSAMAWGDDAWGDSAWDGDTGGGYSSEMFMDFLPYEAWRDLWLFGANRTVTSRPIQLTITPNDGIAVAPAPLAGYTILGDYYAAPVRLALDADQHTLPTKHDDMLIVYEAMRTYGAFWSAPEVYAQADREYKKLMTALENDQLPAPYFYGALA